MLRGGLVLVGLFFLANISKIDCNGAVVFIDTFLYRGSPCKLSDGSEGVCDTHCYLNGSELERSTICSYEKMDQLVCCKTNDPHASYPTIEKFCQEQIQVGKETATSVEQPHIVAFGQATAVGTQWNCEGSLIHPSYVLTTAHCVLDNENNLSKFVYVGATDLSEEGVGENVAVYEVDKIFVHANYTTAGAHNDLAIVRVKKLSTDKNTATPRAACIWTKKEIPRPQLLAVGYVPSVPGDATNKKLYQTSLTILEGKECNKYLNTPQDTVGTQICAMQELDNCQEELGGLLQFNDPEADGQAYLVGVKALGKSCTTESPLIYSGLHSSLPWIESVLQTVENDVHS